MLTHAAGLGADVARREGSTSPAPDSGLCAQTPSPALGGVNPLIAGYRYHRQVPRGESHSTAAV